MVAAGVPARGVKGGLARLLHRKRARTELLGACDVLRALVSGRGFVVAKRWDVRCGTSGSSERDRPGLKGGLARWLRRGRPNRQGVFDGAKREHGRTPMLVGVAVACSK